MSKSRNGDGSNLNGRALNRRNVLLAGSSLAAASAIAPMGGFEVAQAQSPAAPAGVRSAVTEQEARAVGVDAYLYFYPLITMDITRRVAINVEPGKKPGLGPANMFNNFAAFPTADFKTVVRPNFDTLYSSAWLDMTAEPVIVSTPDTGGRYYLLPMLDMWTDVFASPGWRTTGTKAGNFLIAPSGWTGRLPSGMTRIDAPTRHVWIIGRTKTDGPPDYEAVHKIQAGYKITPLSRWGKPAQPVAAHIDPAVDMTTPPKLRSTRCPPPSSLPMRPNCSRSTRRTSPTSQSSRD